MLIPIILSGGVGSRLWPLSRKAKPKHFMPLIDDHIEPDINNAFSQKSLLQQTILRCSSEVEYRHNPFSTSPVMVCDSTHRFLVSDQCKELNIKPEAILLEPERRDTAAAIMLAVLYIYNKYPDAVVLVSPSDHYMSDNDYFFERVHDAYQFAKQNKIVTFGITPSYPETGYGYINADLDNKLDNNVFNVKKFIEKPDRQTALKLLESKEYFWNSGMFVFSVKEMINICKKLQPDLLKYCSETVASSYQQNEYVYFKAEPFKKIKPISIDYALMQDVDDMVVVKYDGQWADVGCWHGVWQNSPREDSGDVVLGNVIKENTNNCYLRSDGRLIVALGVDNVAVIETPDAVLVADIDSSRTLGGIVEKYMYTQQKEFIEHSHVHKPWGEFIVIHDSSGYKVKKLIVKPGEALSLQSHSRRSEHWIVVEGEASVVRGNENLVVRLNETVFIPRNVKHRITNTLNDENLVIIEIQVGDYLGEDDIIRYHDKYGRADNQTEEMSSDDNIVRIDKNLSVTDHKPRNKH